MIMKTVMKNKIIDCRMAKGRLLYVFLTSWQRCATKVLVLDVIMVHM
jgi:hypothetical protein